MYDYIPDPTWRVQVIISSSGLDKGSLVDASYEYVLEDFEFPSQVFAILSS